MPRGLGHLLFFQNVIGVWGKGHLQGVPLSSIHRMDKELNVLGRRPMWRKRKCQA